MYSITCPLNGLHFDVAHVLSVKWPPLRCCTCAVARLKSEMPNMLQTLFGRITGPKHAILIRIFIRTAKPDYIELTLILISQLCPRAYFFKMTPQQVKFTRISGKIDKIIINRF